MLKDRMRTLRDVMPAWCAFVITLALAVFHVASSRGVAQEAPRREGANRDRTIIHSRIDDRAGLFSASAIEGARKELDRIERETHMETTIQTVESLEGKTASATAFHHVRESRLEGLYILIAKEEHAIETLVSRKFLKVLTPEKQKAIRAAMTESFKKKDFDGGLKRGVAMIAQEILGLAQDWGLPEVAASSRAEVSQPAPERLRSGDSPLIVRNQVRLSLAGAKAIIAAAESKAAELKLKLNVAVVDDGGHLVAFERMDGARPASLYTAMTKATSAATFRQPTGPLASGSTPADPLLNVSLQNAAGASGGKITALKGGVPVTVDGQIIGAVGIAGGTGEQDAEVAQAGVKGFIDQLAASARVEKEEEKPE